jgi:L-seryl-tRNA(Ser) seleniumtransferase
MTTAKATERNRLLSNLPSVDELLRTEAGHRYSASEGTDAAAAAARQVLAKLRDQLAAASDNIHDRSDLNRLAEAELSTLLSLETNSGLRRVINATGVLIHTNLGRAPLSDAAKAALTEAAGNCTLEFDLETGKRGRRGGRVERLIAEVCGAEDAVVVNNGAAAAFFVLTALAAGAEVVISRGELVEIGGDFRIPDVLEASGAILKEVGTTNRTKLADYARAIGTETRMILRVHPSNFRIVGFTATSSREDLAALAKEREIIFYEDLGSGALIDLRDAGVPDEPVAGEALKAGVDLVSFSGDKLLGGPQAGIIVGRHELVDRIRKHPLFRVLRPDKLAYAALEATLQAYRKGEIFEAVPVLRQLVLSRETIDERATKLVDAVGALEQLKVEITDGYSTLGGGAAPATNIPTRLIALTHERLSSRELMDRLRMGTDVPVIARIENDAVLLDLRTVAVEDEPTLTEAIRRLGS